MFDQVMLYSYISIGLLDRIVLVLYTYLAFSCLKLNEVICYVQVFQVIGIYGTSSSQVLDLGESEFCLYFQNHVLNLDFV